MAACRAFEADGHTLRLHSEASGGQEVFHIHFHVLPMKHRRAAFAAAGDGRPRRCSPSMPSAYAASFESKSSVASNFSPSSRYFGELRWSAFHGAGQRRPHRPRLGVACGLSGRPSGAEAGGRARRGGLVALVGAVETLRTQPCLRRARTGADDGRGQDHRSPTPAPPSPPRRRRPLPSTRPRRHRLPSRSTPSRRCPRPSRRRGTTRSGPRSWSGSAKTSRPARSPTTRSPSRPSRTSARRRPRADKVRSRQVPPRPTPHRPGIRPVWQRKFLAH